MVFNGKKKNGKSGFDLGSHKGFDGDLKDPFSNKDGIRTLDLRKKKKGNGKGKGFGGIF